MTQAEEKVDKLTSLKAQLNDFSDSSDATKQAVDKVVLVMA